MTNNNQKLITENKITFRKLYFSRFTKNQIQWLCIGVDIVTIAIFSMVLKFELTRCAKTLKKNSVLVALKIYTKCFKKGNIVQQGSFDREKYILTLWWGYEMSF